MKNASLVVVVVALLLGGCLREEALPDLVMVDSLADQPAALKFDPEELLAKMPTAAGTVGEPLWKSLSYSEDLGAAYAERSFALIENDVLEN